MPWAKIDDSFHAHLKARRAWKAHPRALGLHLVAMSYCAGQLTDGLVHLEFVESYLPAARERVAVTSALVDVGLWIPVESGWQIHDWLHYNPAREETAARREHISRVRSDAGRKGAKSKWRKERIAQSMRQDLAQRLGGAPGSVTEARCAYCSARITIDWADPARVRFFDSDGRATPEVDHVEPLADGGAHTSDNLVLACLRCNRLKGRQPAGNLSDGKAGNAWPRPEPDPNPTQEKVDSPAVDGRARAAEKGSPTSLAVLEAPPRPQRLAAHIRGILQRGIDGLTSDQPARRPTTAAIEQTLAQHPCSEDTAIAVAIQVRSIVQAQDRAPNITALYRQRLAEEVRA